MDWSEINCLIEALEALVDKHKLRLRDAQRQQRPGLR